MSNQPNKAELKRRRAQSQRDRERHRREQGEADRRYQQYQRERARNQYRAPIYWPITLSAMKPETPSADDLITGISALFNSTKHADVTIYLGGYKLPAHALILSIGSGYFDKAFESGLQEQDTKTFRFNERREHAHWRVFSYPYTGGYSEEADEKLSVQGRLGDAQVYSLADYFLVDRLKILALENFRTQLRLSWDTDAFTDCISEIYGEVLGNFAELRQAVVEIVADNLERALAKATLQEYMRGNGNFATDVLMQHSKRKDSVGW